jgi:putative ABC transport system permease protein
MLRTTLKGILANKIRLAMTALAVTLGVAFLTGTLVLNDTMRNTFDKLFSSVYAGTDAVVRQKAVFEGAQNTGKQRGRIDAAVLDTVSRVDGVAYAEGSTFGYTRIIGKDGEPLGNPANGPPTFGTNWSDSKELNAFVLVEGRAPRADDEVVIDKQSAIDGHLAVGDTFTVLVQGPPQQVRLVGVGKYGDADSPGGATAVLFTPAAAQRFVGETGKFDAISVVAADGVSQTDVSARIATVLPNGAEVLTGAQMTKETQSEIRDVLSFFTTFMLVFAIVALLVGAFMIFNTFSITVAQRTRESALLRALGASKRQVLSSVLLEALAVGLLASLVGLVGGVAVAAGLKAMLSALGFPIPEGDVVFTSGTAIAALIAGVSITAVAALSPARKAGKVPPIAAMQSVFVGSTGYGSKQRVMVGCGLLVVGIASLFAGLFGEVDNAFAFVGLGALVVFFSVSVLGRTIALPLSRVIGWPLPRLRGLTGQLARENAMRNPKRTAASASALMIGVGLVAFITILAASTTASIDATIDRSFTGDFFVDSGAGLSGGLDPGLTKQLNALPEVKAATGLRVGSARINGEVQFLVAVDPSTAFELFDVKVQQGSTSDLGADSIAIYKDVARDKHLQVGDTVPAEFKDSGVKQLRVGLIYGENRPAGDYFLGLAAYEANFSNRFDMQIFVKKAPGVDTPTALAAVKAAAKPYPGAKVLDQTGYKAEQAKPINQMLALVYALLALAIVIALLGIGNTLALSIFERTRELGLLRAVGMTRSQLRSSIRWESVIIALQGTALGLVIGLFFGWALVQALGDQGIDQFAVPVTSLAVVVVLAALAGVGAAILPSRRAAKLDVLKAIVTE